MIDWTQYDDTDDDMAELGKPQAEAAARKQKKSEKPAMTPLEATIILARRGNKKILPKLRKLLNDHPELVAHYGNLTNQVRENWINLIAAKDLLLAETMRCHLDEMRSDLAGRMPSPLDRLLADRILACHVQVLYFDAMETTDPTAENMRVARYRMDRRDQSHRQFLSAVKTLAIVRNLVARTQTIQIEFRNPPLVCPTTVPNVPKANREQPADQNGHTTGGKSLSNTGATGPISSSNRLNGQWSSHIFETIIPRAEG